MLFGCTPIFGGDDITRIQPCVNFGLGEPANATALGDHGHVSLGLLPVQTALDEHVETAISLKASIPSDGAGDQHGEGDEKQRPTGPIRRRFRNRFNIDGKGVGVRVTGGVEHGDNDVLHPRTFKVELRIKTLAIGVVSGVSVVVCVPIGLEVPVHPKVRK